MRECAAWPWISPRPPSKHAVVATPLTFALSGIANDHPLQAHGTGTLDRGRLVLDLRVEAAPLDLDPVLLVLPGIDPLLAIAGGAVPAPADRRAAPAAPVGRTC